ncbi:hypothetical protein Calab_0826 [Caldithrix abyssi DSM 13497]|uniref:Uncharacterized protein n=1 Tax=Caldithrix abyssi DSM 13497 TaxID=880073 RepID=H1XU21_CALAY|nr:hypothetical protein Cabys_136 [Caldithrix abyssi DSM 13497]EHO40464.1 hypothetical protein Calab_0826 [Caldithrix abyssi DSM 13497]
MVCEINEKMAFNNELGRVVYALILTCHLLRITNIKHFAHCTNATHFSWHYLEEI